MVGIEKNAGFYAQAVETAKFAGSNCEMVNSDIAAYLKTTKFQYDAIFAGSFLYYLKPKELDLLRDKIMSRCSVVLFVSRENKKPEKQKSCINDLYKATSLKCFVECSGMAAELHDIGTNWVSVIGRK